MKFTLSRKIFTILVASGLVLLGLVSMSSVYAQPTGPHIPAGLVSLVNPNGMQQATPTAPRPISVKDLPPIRKPQGAPRVSEGTLDGETWSQLNYGVSGIVYDLAVSGNDIYAVGDFAYVCNNADCSDKTQVNHIAKWNGASWSGVGYGFSGTAYAIAVHDDDIYVGGDFKFFCGTITCANPTTVNNIARWDGTSWHAVGSGFNYSVRAITFVGNDLYAGGSFTQICGEIACGSSGNTAAHAIAKWNGSKWMPMGKGFDSTVRAIASRNSILYAGGDFKDICGNAACNSGNQQTNYLAQWNGSAWSPVVYGVSGSVRTLVARDDYLFIGGNFLAICDNVTCNSYSIINYVAAWDGTVWYRVAYGVNDQVNDLISYGKDLYAAGSFFRICDSFQCFFETRIANRLARWNWNTGEWEPLTNGVFDTAYALTTNNGMLYAGGDISETSSNNPIPLKNIGQYGPLTFNGPTYTPTPTKTNTPLVSSTPTPSQTPTTGTCSAAPTKPTLTAPANNSTANKTRVTLKWNAAGCATTYNVTVKAVGGGNGDNKTGLTATQYKTKALAKSKTYKWFVKACNTIGCTKSKAFKFTIQ